MLVDAKKPVILHDRRFPPCSSGRTNVEFQTLGTLFVMRLKMDPNVHGEPGGGGQM